jgi:hypothetical protein
MIDGKTAKKFGLAGGRGEGGGVCVGSEMGFAPRMRGKVKGEGRQDL